MRFVVGCVAEGFGSVGPVLEAAVVVVCHPKFPACEFLVDTPNVVFSGLHL
jgi:hypothetical protein